MRAQLRRTPFTAPPLPSRLSRASRLEVCAAVKKSSLRNIVCSKTLKLKDGYADQAKELCHKIADLAHEEMKDTSKGILAFEVFQDPFEEKRIHFWERYADNTRMGRFNTSDPFQAFMNDIQDCLEEPVGLALYDWKDGQLGPLAVQGGPKGAGGRGASSYSQTSDVVNLSDVKRGEEGDSFGMGKVLENFKLPEFFKFPWDN